MSLLPFRNGGSISSGDWTGILESQVGQSPPREEGGCGPKAIFRCERPLFLMAAPYRACAGSCPPAAIAATPPHEEGGTHIPQVRPFGCAAQVTPDSVVRIVIASPSTFFIKHPR